MANLQLSLKKQWFEMTKSGIKTEDYREITPYWAKRFLKYNGKVMSTNFWASLLIGKEFIEMFFEDISFVNFDSNIMTLGYPKSTDSDRILKLEHKGIEIRTGNPEWGAEPNKIYFVILHGRLLAPKVRYFKLIKCKITD